MVSPRQVYCSGPGHWMLAQPVHACPPIVLAGATSVQLYKIHLTLNLAPTIPTPTTWQISRNEDRMKSCGLSTIASKLGYVRNTFVVRGMFRCCCCLLVHGLLTLHRTAGTKTAVCVCGRTRSRSTLNNIISQLMMMLS